jgi:hypothetical protein
MDGAIASSCGASALSLPVVAGEREPASFRRFLWTRFAEVGQPEPIDDAR